MFERACICAHACVCPLVSYRKKAAGPRERLELADGWPITHRFSCSQELTTLSSTLRVSRDTHPCKEYTHTTGLVLMAEDGVRDIRVC